MAMLAFALVPTLSRAMAFASGNASFAEVCTPQGLKLVTSDDTAGPDSGGPAAHSLDHCAFCGLATDGAAPLPAAPAAVVLPVAGAEPPALFLRAPRTLHAWATAQPRAPPALS